MSAPTDDDMRLAREALRGIRHRTLHMIARFRDGLEMEASYLHALEGLGFVDYIAGRYVARAGIIEAFTEIHGAGSVPPHYSRAYEGRGNAQQKEILRSQIATPDSPTSDRRNEARQPGRPVKRPAPVQRGNRRARRDPVHVPIRHTGTQEPEQRADTRQGAERLAVPATQWRGEQTIPGENPIGNIVQKMRRAK